MYNYEKMFSLILAIVLIFGCSTSVYAAEGDCNAKIVTERVITDTDEIQRIQRMESVEVPDGYYIEEIKYTTVVLDGAMMDAPQPQLFDTWTVGNVTTKGYEYYFPDSPLSSDWIDGAASYTESFTFTVTGQRNANAKVKDSTIEAAVGFSLTTGVEYTKSYQIDVPAGKKMNLKVYGNYIGYDFDIYKNGEYQGAGKAYKPIGLTFKQVLYAK